MLNPAAPSDLANRGYNGPASETVQQTRLNEAWRALRREIPGLIDQIRSGDLEEADAVDVICAATMRVLRNPEGFESESTSIDDYQESFRRADASIDLYFTAAELRRLQPVAAYRGGWSGSVRYC